MKRLIKHFKRWNKWRKGCFNSRLYKFLVLIGLVKSPSFAWTFTDDEISEMRKGFDDALIDRFNSIPN